MVFGGWDGTGPAQAVTGLRRRPRARKTPPMTMEAAAAAAMASRSAPVRARVATAAPPAAVPPPVVPGGTTTTVVTGGHGAPLAAVPVPAVAPLAPLPDAGLVSEVELDGPVLPVLVELESDAAAPELPPVAAGLAVTVAVAPAPPPVAAVATVEPASEVRAPVVA